MTARGREGAVVTLPSRDWTIIAFDSLGDLVPTMLRAIPGFRTGAAPPARRVSPSPSSLTS